MNVGELQKILDSYPKNMEIVKTTIAGNKLMIVYGVTVCPGFPVLDSDHWVHYTTTNSTDKEHEKSKDYLLI